MIYISLILPVILGSLIARFVNPKTNIIKIFLSFSGAYLLSMTVLHLIPEIYSEQSNNIGIYILIGIVLQTILEFFSKGAEHGHVHLNENNSSIPWTLFISLCLHAFIEGMPLGIGNNKELLWSIIIHKIPVTIILALFFKKTAISPNKIILLLTAFALMSPMGSYLSHSIPLIQKYHIEITAIIVGIFLHISTAILFESSKNHQFNLTKFIAIIIGFILAFVSI